MTGQFQEQIDAIFALMKTYIEQHEDAADWELAWMMVEIEPGHGMIYGRFRRENNPIKYSFEARFDLLDMAEKLQATMLNAGHKWDGAKFILHRDGRSKADFRHDNFWTRLKKRLTRYYPARDDMKNVVWGGLDLE